MSAVAIAAGVGAAASVGGAAASAASQSSSANGAKNLSIDQMTAQLLQQNQAATKATGLVDPWVGTGNSANATLAGLLGITTPDNLKAPDVSQFQYVTTKPGGGMQIAVNYAAFMDAVTNYQTQLKALQTLQQNGQVGSLLKPYGQDQYQQDPGYQPVINSLQDYQNSPNYTPLANNQQSYSQALGYYPLVNDLASYKNDPGYTPFVNTLEELQATPGYQFQLQQGLQSVNNSAAAKGSLLSGNSLKAIDDYSQGLASTSFQQAWDRAQQAYSNAVTRGQTALSNAFNRGQSAYQTAVNNGQQAYQNAFSRNLAQNQNLYSMLSGQSSQGLNAANSAAGMTQQAGQNNSNTIGTAGNAAQQAIYAGGQATSNGVAGVNQALQSGIQNYTLGQYLNNPASVSVGGIGSAVGNTGYNLVGVN